MEDELIKRSEAIDAVDETLKRIIVAPVGKDILDRVPTVDAVPVVRCSTCRYYDKRNDPSGETSGSHPYCHRFCDYIDADGYCKWGVEQKSVK